jgi:hypothetical protein
VSLLHRYRCQGSKGPRTRMDVGKSERGLQSIDIAAGGAREEFIAMDQWFDLAPGWALPLVYPGLLGANTYRRLRLNEAPQTLSHCMKRRRSNQTLQLHLWLLVCILSTDSDAKIGIPCTISWSSLVMTTEEALTFQIPAHHFGMWVNVLLVNLLNLLTS